MTLWMPEHMATLLPAVLIGLLAVVLLRLLIGRAPLFVRMIPMQLISLALLALEVQKQISSYRAGYSYYHLPFHFCSLFLLVFPLFLLVFPLASFYFGPGAEAIRSLALTCAATVTILTLLAPEYIYSYEHVINFGTVFMSTHTVIFHCLVPIFCFLMLFLDACKPRIWRDLAIIVVFVGLYSVLAAKMAWRFETNFSNFYFCSVEQLEERRLTMVAERGEEAARRIYAAAVGGVHIAGNIIGCLAGAQTAWLIRWLPLGERSRK